MTVLLIKKQISQTNMEESKEIYSRMQQKETGPSLGLNSEWYDYGNTKLFFHNRHPFIPLCHINWLA